MRKRTVIILSSVASITASALGGGVAFGAGQSVPDSVGTIHGCYKASGYATGALTVIDTDAGQSCPSDMTAVNWSQTGPAGPSTAGSSGLDQTMEYGQTGGGGQTILRVNCPSDHPYAMGGGYEDIPVPETVSEDRPAAPSAQGNPLTWTGPAGGWQVQIASNPSNEIWTVYAICAK